MPSVKPATLDLASPDVAFATLTRLFRWLRPEVSFVRDCLTWQSSTSPRPGPHFRWHLPRFVLACQLVTRTLDVDEDGELESLSGRTGTLEAGSSDPAALLRADPFPTPTVVIRRSFYESHGGFRPELIHVADWRSTGRKRYGLPENG